MIKFILAVVAFWSDGPAYFTTFLFLIWNTCSIICDRNKWISTGEESTSLTEGDFETVTAHSIFQPTNLTSQTAPGAREEILDKSHEDPAQI